MMPLLRADARKLLTIRSTYIILAIGMLLAGFISFWVLGYKNLSPAAGGRLPDAATTGATIIAVFIAITAVLTIAHEYRYNTIMYTLTAANSRSKVLLSKVLVASAYVLVTTLVVMTFTAMLAWIGSAVRGTVLEPQHFHWWSLIWRSVFFVWGYAMVGMIIATLFRHVVAAIAVLLVVPSTVEGLLSLVLHDNVKYLPFGSLEQVNTGAQLSPGRAALLFCLYVVGGWLIAWLLFLKRDAN